MTPTAAAVSVSSPIGHSRQHRISPRSYRALLPALLLLILLGASPVAIIGATPLPRKTDTSSTEPVVETRIPYKGDTIIIRSRKQSSEKGVFTATGNVEIRYRDMFFRSDELAYNTETHILSGSGNIVFRKGSQVIHCGRFEFDVQNKIGQFYDTRGVADNNFHIESAVVKKEGPNLYIFENGTITTCREEHPHWLFHADHARIVEDKSATLRGSVFRLFGVPVFYLPWVKFPILERGRQSGFMIPSMGNSNQKGRRISEGFYLTLGRSADLVLRGDYFSKRGFGVGLAFRSKFSDVSYLDFASYSVNDRQGDGGSVINAESYFTFGNGFRGAVSANIITNIVFRQVYEESFAGAVRPDEVLNIHISKIWNLYAFSANVDRRQFFFESSQVVNRAMPDVAFSILGSRLPHTPIYFFLNTSVAALHKEVKWQPADGSGEQAVFKTPNTTFRLDAHPRLLLPVHPGGLFHVSFMPAVRGTWYSDGLVPGPYEPDTVPLTRSESVFRRYASLDVRLEGPRIFRVFHPFGIPLKHVIEWGGAWRWVSDIDNYGKIILFDYHDAIVPTNQFDYHLTQRFITLRDGRPWEWASITLRQIYYFSPDFYGTFLAGTENQIAPYYTFSPFLASYSPRRFSPIQLTSRINPNPRFSGSFRLEYDTVRQGVRDWVMTGTYQHNDWVFASLGYLRLRPLEGFQENSNYFQTSLGFGHPQKGWSAEFNISYNLENSNTDNIYFRVNYYTDCLGLSAEYINFDIYRRSRENEIRFSLYLRGIGRFGRLRKLGRRPF